MATVLQFDWRLNWKKRVAPHLDYEVMVCGALDQGMKMLTWWKRGDAPYSDYGVAKGNFLLYQPLGYSHFVSFFSMAIGALNYPKLDWRFLNGDRHVLPVGYGADGVPKVVMDILFFDSFTAEESIAAARKMDRAYRAATSGATAGEEIKRVFCDICSHRFLTRGWGLRGRKINCLRRLRKDAKG